MTDHQQRDPLARAAAEGGLPTMSTDNTPAGQYAADVGSEPIAMVREGMKVVDMAGDDIGTVRRVRMGDPQAVTTEGQETDTGDNFLTDIAEALVGDDDVPETYRNELTRVGYIQIDARGLFQADYAAAAFQIAEVAGDTVRLSVDRDALVRL